MIDAIIAQKNNVSILAASTAISSNILNNIGFFRLPKNEVSTVEMSIYKIYF